MTALARPEKVPRPADLEIGIRDLEAVSRPDHGAQPQLTLLAAASYDQHTAPAPLPSAHPPAQLMQLR